MYCPRCGRQVNNSANFCGGCGLSKKEIDEQLSKTNTYNYTEPVFEKAPRQTGEVENFIEQPFPTDVEFKDVVEEQKDESQPAEASTVEIPTVNVEKQYQASQEQYQTPQDRYPRQDEQYQEPEVPPQKKKRDEALSTVDFVWMILLSIIPGVNVIYLFYQAFIQNNNINRRSYARAVFIVVLFIILIGIMFGFGFLLANLIY